LRLAAVDLGAQSGRVAVGTFDGDRLTVDEVHRFPNEPVDDAGVLRWDLEGLREEVSNGLRRATRDLPVASVAVDSWGVDFGLLDGTGALLQSPAHYRNARRAAAFERALEVISPRELYGRTGIQLLPINTIFELAALASDGDPVLDEARRLLLIPDLFHHWLCGSETSEWTNATTTQCFDPRADDWARDLLDRLGVPTSARVSCPLPGLSAHDRALVDRAVSKIRERHPAGVAP